MSNCPICDAIGCTEALTRYYVSALRIFKKPKGYSGGYKQRRLERFIFSKRIKRIPINIGIRKDQYQKLMEANNV